MGFIKHIIDSIKYDEHGFDGNGIHKDTGTPYDEEGYDRYGYDIAGFNRKGFNENGFHISRLTEGEIKRLYASAKEKYMREIKHENDKTHEIYSQNNNLTNKNDNKKIDDIKDKKSGNPTPGCLYILLFLVGIPIILAIIGGILMP